MTHVEHLPVYMNYFSPARISPQKFRESLPHKKEVLPPTSPLDSFEVSFTSSQESFDSDSGYQSSSSPEPTLKSKIDERDVLISETYGLPLNKGRKNGHTRRFQGQEDQGTEGREYVTILEAHNRWLCHIFQLNSVQEKNHASWREDRELLQVYQHVSQPGTSSNRQVGAACHNSEDEVQQCKPIMPHFNVVKRAVRHLQETVHQRHSYKKFQCKPMFVDQSKAEVVYHSKAEVCQSKAEAVSQHSAEVSQCTAEIVPQFRNKIDPHCKEEVQPQSKNTSKPQNKAEVSQCKPVSEPHSKTEVEPQCRDKKDPHCKEEVLPQTKERVVLKSINKVEPLSKDTSEPRHKEVKEVVEPQSKGEEVLSCKGEVGSQIWEHLRESVRRLKKKKDPLYSKKRLRRQFRGQCLKLYVPEDLEEPPFQYVPEVLPTSASIKGVVPPLQESLMLLGEGLEAGSLVAQFEQLYRRKPGLTVTEARRQENEKKNRYRDISPYDSTRVILTTTPSGDYINASYVNMEVQASGIVNRYIACQGPLAGTCTDFWHMVWEQQSTLIVMLTTVVEQGRIKCHRYWPRLYETVDFGILQVTCNKEEETPGFAFREFTLINTETQEERHITHMQYLAWPDHGVPDDSTEFLNFVTQVRKARVGMVEPTIVHCSAGIGRTGVLILMETAQCLIEANEPIYPLDIVKAMRDQRAMMIQTASQFRFVCEAIHRVYTEELIKPLAEYEQR